MTFKAGEVLFIPAGTIHSAKNVGSVNERSSPRISSKTASRSSGLVNYRIGDLRAILGNDVIEVSREGKVR